MSTTTIISKDLIEGANNNSFFDRGNALERDAQNESAYFDNCDEIKSLEKRLGGFTDEQKALLADRSLSWKALVKEQYNTQASFNASNVPWFIAGPAKYNQSRYNKRLDAAMNKYNDFEEKKQRFIKNTIDMLKKLMPAENQVKLWREGRQGYGETIASDDPLAVEKMTAHVEYLKEEHAAHVAWNKAIRSGKLDQIKEISDKAKKDILEEITRLPYRKREFFFTSNETANIRNKSARLEQMKKARAIVEEEKAEGLKIGVSEKEGLRMENNHEAARVQLFFDGKPDEETRARLKANGFRWSPRFGAWQRQNTPQGLSVAQKFFDSYKEAV